MGICCSDSAKLYENDNFIEYEIVKKMRVRQR